MEDLIMIVGIALLPVMLPLIAWLWYCIMTGRDGHPWVRRCELTYTYRSPHTHAFTGTMQQIDDHIGKEEAYSSADIAVLRDLPPVRKRGSYVHGVDGVEVFDLRRKC